MFKKSEQAGDKTPKSESKDHVAKAMDANATDKATVHKSTEQQSAKPAVAANEAKK